MDPQTPKLTSASGHDGHAVHHCSKCGWPFPKPHPSAKHRRAHKRVCGTVEGYENTHLPVLDDEHHSDEDWKTLSPKPVERSNSGSVGSGRIGVTSSRSGDEVFADAVQEFCDSEASSKCEVSTENAEASSKDLENVVKDNLHSTGLNVIQQLKEPTEANQNYDEETESSMRLPQGNNSSSIVELAKNNGSDVRPEKSVIELQKDGMGPQCEPMGAETSTAKLRDGNYAKHCSATYLSDGKSSEEPYISFQGAMVPEFHVPSLSMGAIGSLSSCLVVEDSAVECNDGNGSDHDSVRLETHTVHKNANTGEIVQYPVPCIGLESNSKGSEEVEDSSSDIKDSACKPAREILRGHDLQEMDMRISDPVESIPEVKEEQFYELPRATSSGDHFFEAESFQHEDGCISDNAAQEVVLAKEIDGKIDDYLVDGGIRNNLNNEGVHVLSVPDDIPLKDDPKILLQEFKDHNPRKLDGGVENNRGCLYKSLVQLNDFGESTVTSNVCTFARDCTVTAEDEESNKIIKDASVERMIDSSELKMMGRKNLHSGDAETSEVFMRSGTGSEKSQDVSLTEEESAANSLTSLLSSEVRGMTKSFTAGDDNIKVAACGSVTMNTKEISETERDSLESEVQSQTIDLVMVDNVADPTVWHRNFPGDENGESASCDTSNMNVTKTPESSSCSTTFQPVNDGKDGIELIAKSNVPCVDAAIDVGKVGSDTTKDKEMQERSDVETCKSKVLVAYATDIKIEKSVQDDFCHKSLRSSIEQEILLLPVAAESASKSLTSPEDNKGKECDSGPPCTTSVSFQDIGNVNDAEPQLSVSPTDALGDSSSQTDSLEGNWGSVSVISTQSDAPVVNAEALPESSDSQKSRDEAKNEARNPSTVATVPHQFDSDAYEAPSFMTLVEPKNVPDQTANTPDTRVPSQQPDSALQAAWFPSVAHVVNESSKRKKNEEIIAKVTSWSNNRKPQHTPLKSFLGDDHGSDEELLPKSTSDQPSVEKDETSIVAHGATRDLGAEALSPPAKMEMAKEWNSPARYPAAIKTEKRKLKGRPYWAQFVCCSSVN